MDNIIESLITKIRDDYNSQIEKGILKELCRLGYNFDSYELRNLFAAERLIIIKKHGSNFVYLDNTIPVFAWKDPELNLGWNA